MDKGIFDMKVLSVIVPAKNEASSIKRCIQSIFGMGLDGYSLEVIVVDNNSTDLTAQIAEENGATVLFSKATSISEIRNIGARHSSGQILAYVDADCSVPNNWFLSALCFLSQKRVGAVGGGLDLPVNASWIERAWALPTRSEAQYNVELVGASLFLRRSIFEGVNGFDASIQTGEDSDISKRIIERGYKTCFTPKCNVVHYGYPSTITGFIDRQIWQVQGQFSFDRLMSDKSLLASLAFATLLVFSIFSFFFIGLWFLVLVSISMLIPFGFFLKKLKKSDFDKNVSSYISVFSVCCLYLIARFLGVVVSTAGIGYKRRYKD